MPIVRLIFLCYTTNPMQYISRSTFLAAAIFLYATLPIVATAATPSPYRLLVDQRASSVSLHAEESASILQRITLAPDATMIQAQLLPNDPNGRFVVLFLHNTEGWLAAYTTDGMLMKQQRVMHSSDERFLHSIRLRSITPDRTHDTTYRITVHGLKYLHEKKSEYLFKKTLTLRLNDSVSVQSDDAATFRTLRLSRTPVTHAASSNNPLALLNYYRKASGVMPVRLDHTLSERCEQHVQYMETNNELTHYQDSAKPDATPDGALAGRSSDLASGVRDMQHAIELWIHSLYHRLPLLDPSMTQIGMAFSPDGGYACLYVYGINESMRNVQYHPVAFPAPGMTHVPTAFKGNERPDPLTGQSAQYPVGEVMTLSFPSEAHISAMTVTLSDTHGSSVRGLTRLPRDPNDPSVAVQRNTVSFIPLAPLAAGVRYTVTVHGIVDHAPFSTEWTFRTVE